MISFVCAELLKLKFVVAVESREDITRERFGSGVGESC